MADKPVTLKRQPARLDLEVYAGDSFPFEMTVPMDLNGYSVRVQARRDSTSSALWSFSTVNARVTVSQVAVNPVKYKVAFTVNPTETRLVGDGLAWDMQLEAPNGDTRTWLWGEVRSKGDYARA
jgi:hypothetical protein